MLIGALQFVAQLAILWLTLFSMGLIMKSTDKMSDPLGMATAITGILAVLFIALVFSVWFWGGDLPVFITGGE